MRFQENFPGGVQDQNKVTICGVERQAVTLLPAQQDKLLFIQDESSQVLPWAGSTQSKSSFIGVCALFLAHDGQNSFLGLLFWKVKGFNSLLAAFSQWTLLKEWAHRSFTDQTHLIRTGWGGSQPWLSHPTALLWPSHFLQDGFNEVQLAKHKWNPQCETHQGTGLWAESLCPWKVKVLELGMIWLQGTTFSEWAILFFHREIPF